MNAVFYDRDGIIIKMVYDLKNGLIETPRKTSEIKFIPGIFNLLKHTAKLGYKNIIISNQAGIGIEKISEENFEILRKEIIRQINEHGAVINAEYYCFHHPFASIKKYKKVCDCRKPKPGLLRRAAAENKIDLSKSWMIGDGVKDVLAGKSAGCKTILLANLYESEYMRILEEKLKEKKPDYLIKNIREAVKIIKS